MNQLPDNLVFLNACPHDPYFLWQQEVMITNFRKFGISDRIQIIVWYPKGSTQLLKWRDLQNKYPEVKVYLYPDQGVQLGLYVSQLRPHVLVRHFDNNAAFFKDKVVFYHDSDIIFNYLPDFQTLCADEVVYQSDTHFYLDYTYLRNKEKQGNLPEHEAVDLLAKIGRVSRETIQHYDGNTGGAQTLLKNVDGNFWRDVERMCLEIRYNFVHFQEFPINPNSVNTRYFQAGNGLTGEQNGFQSWCADMWALNFALWNRGIVTQNTPLLDFSWATDTLETFNKKPIFHNAGATRPATPPDNIFYKGEWIGKSPIGVDLPLPKEGSASREYVKAILSVKP